MIAKLKENRVDRTYKGGVQIDRFMGKSVCEDTFFPEDWTASCTVAYNSTGTPIGLGMTEEGLLIKDIVGNDPFPILVKLLHAAERLVIQAHPTVDFAKTFLNSPYGKTECWYFLDCLPEAHVYLGFKPGICREDWKQAFETDDSERMLAMLHRIPVKAGDFVFVDGGVPHAIGGGCFMVELQEPSDWMVVHERFTPSGREIPEKRLHMGLGYEKMLDVYDYTGYSLTELKQKFCPEKREIAPHVFEVLGASLTDKFAMYLLAPGAKLTTEKKYRIALVLSGNGTLSGKPITKGDRLFLAEESAVTVTGSEDLRVIICEDGGN